VVLTLWGELLGGAAAAWPLGARAQQPERMRRIGVIMPLSSNDPEAQARLTAFKQALQQLGWTEERNVRIDYRWGAGDTDLNRKNAAELVTLAPDVILATGTPTLEPLERATRTVPIVFVQVADPVGAGLVKSLARPGGNATGFSTVEYVNSGKWLELLKEIAPNVKRAAVLRGAKSPTVCSISMGSRTLTGLTSTPSDGAPAWTMAHCPIPAPPCGGLRRSNPQGREASGPASANAYQVPDHHQSQDRQGAQSHRAAVVARTCRRVDRMKGAMSAIDAVDGSSTGT
jgi:hypothetical protein